MLIFGTFDQFKQFFLFTDTDYEFCQHFLSNDDQQDKEIEEEIDKSTDHRASKRTYSDIDEENEDTVPNNIEKFLKVSMNVNDAETIENRHQRLQNYSLKPSIGIPSEKLNKKPKVGEAAYIRNNGTVCNKLEFSYYRCKCHYNCKELDFDTRKNIYDFYWDLGSFDAQTNYMISTTRQVR